MAMLNVARGIAFVPMVGVALHDLVATVKRVDGVSMEPTLAQKTDWVFLPSKKDNDS